MGNTNSLCSNDKSSKNKEDKENKKEGETEGKNENKNESEEIDILNEELLDINISYIIIGLNRNFDGILNNPNTYHISLFLYSRYNSKKGIIMEFAKYTQKKEQTDIKYPYKEEGGLRYYSSTRPAYINNLCDIGNINIKLETSYFFRDILNKCCEDREWTKDNYKMLLNNCQDFVGDSMKKFNLNYELSDVNFHIPDIQPADKIKYIPDVIKPFCIQKNKYI